MVEYLERAGWQITTVQTSNMTAAKDEHSVHDEAASCHTALRASVLPTTFAMPLIMEGEANGTFGRRTAGRTAIVAAQSQLHH